MPLRKDENDMGIEPIRTESDYEAAVRRIEALWGADPGTPEGDELDVLATFVEAYEKEHYVIDPPSSKPGSRRASRGSA